MKHADAKKRLEEIQMLNEIQDRESSLLRARSVTVGTAFGGTTELSMRGNNGSSLWCIMQPVEVIELIHQLAANVGCHISLQPREDFSSWRNWKYTEAELLHYNNDSRPGVGHAPHVNDIAPHKNKGQILPPPDQQPGLKTNKKEEHVVAIEKNINKRITKRASKTT